MTMTGRNGRGRFGALFLCLFILACVPGLSGFSSLGGAPECRDQTPEFTEMPVGYVTIADTGKTIDVRIAATDSHRAAGMQHLCKETIADNPILFLFDGPLRPSFHMNNVLAPLDIVFIDAGNRVVDVARMEPNQSALTRPAQPVVAALELAAGQSAAYRLEHGVRVEWGRRNDSADEGSQQQPPQ